MEPNIPNRTIFCDDNLDVMRGINDQCIDLIYLDPPFNKNKEFAAPIGSSAEGASFKDIFREEDLKDEWVQTIAEDWPELHRYLNGIKGVGKPYNFAYLAYMAIRLIECRRILRETGSIYLHCDPTMSHYLKTTMDCIFGEENFRNEIVWRRTGAHNSADRFGPIHDVILFYARPDYRHRVQFGPYLRGHVKQYFRKSDQRGRYWTNSIHGSGIRKGKSGEPWRGYNPTTHGRHWAIPSKLVFALGIDPNLPQHEKLDALDLHGVIDFPPVKSNSLPTYRQYLSDSPGQPFQDLWVYQPHTKGTLEGSDNEIDKDVRWIPKRDKKERTGYPTQKPFALLERIIQASSNEGDIVLDPFCGCATTCVAAEKLDRQWIGIDISVKAYELVQKRMKKEVDKPQQDFFKGDTAINLKTDPPKRTDQDADHREKKFVYVISHPNFPGEYKVGIAKDWKSRLNSYQTSDPERQYEMEFKTATPWFRETEKHIHDSFPNKHEWVQGDLDEIIKAIEKYRP